MAKESSVRKLLVGVLIGLLNHAPVIAVPVADAAKKGNVAEIERLLDAGGDPNEPDTMLPPLHLAAMSGHVEAVQLLLIRGADPEASSSLGTPLHAAVKFSREETVKALLSGGVDPDGRDDDGYTPLIRAASRPNVPVVEALIDGGADVHAIAIGKGNLNTITGPLIALHEANLAGLDEVSSALRAGGAGPIMPEVPTELASLGNPERGREFAYSDCKICHTISANDVPNGPHPYYQSVVPTLVGIMGRPVASLPDFDYSEELIDFGGIWTPERFYQFALTSMLTMPGTRMDWSPDRRPEMIADIIAYFNSEAE
jgi:cytochrome c2